MTRTEYLRSIAGFRDPRSKIDPERKQGHGRSAGAGGPSRQATWKTPAVDVQGAHHVALSVGNLEASTAFYEGLFDLEVFMNEASDDRKATVYRVVGTDIQLGLVEHKSTKGPFDPRQLGLDHFAFSVKSREDLEGWASRLAERGVPHSKVVDVRPGAILNFKDPDGIALAIFWDRT